MSKAEESLLKHIDSLEGKKVNTIYGVCLVAGTLEKDGKYYVHLKEDNNDDYFPNFEEFECILTKG